jgi:hypothetical protein
METSEVMQLDATAKPAEASATPPHRLELIGSVMV